MHKKSIDPLIISTVVKKTRWLVRKYSNRSKLLNNESIKYTIPTETVRRELKTNLSSKAILKYQESIIPTIDIKLYRDIGIPIGLLMFLVKCINPLPLAIFKNLEQSVYEKM